MKKHSFFILDWISQKNERGFILPYVLFVTSFLFVIITASINIYEQDIKITHHQVEQIKIETLFQLGLATFKEEHQPNSEPHYKSTYIFPDGEVTITYTLVNESAYQLYFSIVTNNESVYTVLYTDKN